MIDENELLRHLPRFDDERQLEKDYLLNLMLKVLSMTDLSAHAVFKGGTAMSFFYGLDRFSEDLDFTYMYGKSEGGNEALRVIDKSVSSIITEYGSNYTIRKKKVGVLGKDSDGSMRDVRSEFCIEVPVFSRTGRAHKIKREISLRKDLIDAPKTAEKVISKYRDIGGMLLYVMSEAEMVSEKACAIVEREKARDIYDMFFLMKYKNIRFDHKLFTEKIQLRNEGYGIAELRDNIRNFDEARWKQEMSHLLKQRPDLSAVKKALLEGIGTDGG